jgi:ADP-heptose:LPS heptosyltransferase
MRSAVVLDAVGCSVNAVRSFEQAQRAVFSADKPSFRDFLSRLFIGAVVFLSNLCLYVMEKIMFYPGGIKSFSPRNIVVYTVGIVGDNVVMLPALAAIRRCYPDAFITVISNCQIWDSRGAYETLGPSRFKDRLLVISDYPVERRGFSLVFNKHLFPDVQCDLFINLSPFGNRGWIGAVVKEMIFAYKIGASHVAGIHVASYSRGDWFNRVKHHFVQNEPRRSRRVLSEMGISPAEGEDLFEHDPMAKDSVMQKLQVSGWDGRPLFVINPGAKFRSKCWPSQRFGQIAEHVSKVYKGYPVITGIEAERDIAEEVKNHASCRVSNLAGKTTIQELVELLRLSRCCITNDTGTMHISAMTNTPTVALFSMRHSPTDWFPLGHSVTALFCLPGCIYCYDDGCQSGDCMEMIDTPHVEEAIGKVMAGQ